MSKSKLTLIVDGNWLLMSRLAVLNNRYNDDEKMCKDLKIMLIKSINIVLRQFQNIDNIIFVADGGSWRNYLNIPSFLQNENIEYKGNREPDPNVNWDLIFSSYEDFINKLKQNGITAVKEVGIEGDDWCWYWSTKLNSEGTNCIIWSKDKDLTQLVHTDKNKCFTVWWNKDSGVVAENASEEDMDFLFNSAFNTNENLFNSITDKCKSISIINPKEVIIDKILRGDAGDNILPIILRTAKPNKDGIVTSDRQYKISTKDIDITLDIHNDNQIKNYINSLLESKSYIGRVNKPIDDIIEHFNYNVQLVSLEKSSYPEYILNTMNEYTDYNCSKNTSEVEYQLVAEANSINSILDII